MRWMQTIETERGGEEIDAGKHGQTESREKKNNLAQRQKQKLLLLLPPVFHYAGGPNIADALLQG